MNKKRRNALNRVLDGLARLRDPIDKEEAVKLIQDAQVKVEQCSDEEQDALDNRPETLRWSTISDNMNDNISDLTDVAADLEAIASDLEDADEYRYDAIKGGVIKVVNIIKQVIHR